MDKILYYLYIALTYVPLKLRYRGLRNLRFNGHGIAIVGAKNMQVGVGSYLSYNTRIYVGRDSKLIIGDRVSIGHNVRIYTVKVNLNKYLESGIKESIENDVVIGTDVTIAGNVYVAPGVSICDKVFIGANSVVVKDIRESGVYSGVPAKKIK